jgi:hypothetical protein
MSRFITSVPYPGFTPTSLSGCSLWLDAADSTTISGTSSITAWRDKSGNNNNAIFSGTNPSYVAASNVVITANANQNFTVPAAAIQQSAGSGSLFFVYGDQQTGGSWRALWGTATPSERFYQSLQSAENSYAVNGPFTPSGTVTTALNTTNTIIYNMNYTYGSSTGDLRINGTTVSSSYQGVPNPSGALTLSGTGWGVVANVRLYEVISYKGATALTTSQQQQIEGYLAQKWGLTARLPGGHPGLTQTLYAAPKARTLLTKQVYPSFTPLAASGCRLWLDAADPAGTGIAPANGSTISSWVDKSGTGNNGTSYGNPTFVTSAFNGKPSISFNGSTQRFVGAITNTGNTVSVFAIVNMNSGGQWGRICSLGVTNNFDGGVSSLYFIPLIRSSTNQSIQSGRFQGSTNVNVGPVAITYNVPFQAASIVNGTSNILYLNGTSVGSGSSTGNFGYTAYGIGAQPSDFQPEYFQGFISEIIIYNTDLTTTQRQQVEGYLAWKWGLQASLSNTHPYYSAAPSAAGVPANPTRFMTQVPYSGYSNVRYVRFTGGLSPSGDNWQDIAELSVYGPTGINLALGKSITQTNGYTATNTGLGVYGVATSVNESSQQISGASLVDGDPTTGLESQNYIPVIDLGSNCLVSSGSIWLGKFWGRSLNGQFDLLNSSNGLIKRWTITDTSSRQITWKWPN